MVAFFGRLSDHLRQQRVLVMLAALDAVIANATAADQPAQKSSQRTPSKQAQVLALLQHDDGATLQQMCALTNWQAHTVRGALAGAFKKTSAWSSPPAKTLVVNVLTGWRQQDHPHEHHDHRPGAHAPQDHSGGPDD